MVWSHTVFELENMNNHWNVQINIRHDASF